MSCRNLSRSVRHIGTVPFLLEQIKWKFFESTISKAFLTGMTHLWSIEKIVHMYIGRDQPVSTDRPTKSCGMGCWGFQNGLLLGGLWCIVHREFHNRIKFLPLRAAT